MNISNSFALAYAAWVTSLNAIQASLQAHFVHRNSNNDDNNNNNNTVYHGNPSHRRHYLVQDQGGYWAYHANPVPDEETSESSATSSDDDGPLDREVDQYLFKAYAGANRRWRLFTGKPVRALRRVLKFHVPLVQGFALHPGLWLRLPTKRL